MRLLLTLDTWSLIGGSERYAGAAAASLQARGHQVRVLATRSSSPEPAAHVQVTTSTAYSDPHPTAPDLSALAQAAKSHRPDAILALTPPAAPAQRALFDVAPLVRFVQDHTPICPGLNKMRADATPCREPMGLACLQQAYLGPGCHGFHATSRGPDFQPLAALRKHLGALAELRSCARLLVASEHMRRELIAAGLSPARIARVPYVTLSNTPELPASAIDPATEAFLQRHAALPKLLAPARLVHPDKGIDHLLTALTKLDAPAATIIAGQGPAQEWLQRKAREEQLGEHVHFAGWQPPGALETLYTRCDAVAFPSVWDEPFGLVGLEAMVHAKPVVAYDVGGVRDWLAHGESGLCVPRSDTDALARALERILGQPDLARRMGAAGRARAESEFSRERGVEALERELERAADSGTGPIADQAA